MSASFDPSAFDVDFLADDGDDDITEILTIACESFGSPGAHHGQGDAL
jgi:hypothetical protein